METVTASSLGHRRAPDGAMLSPGPLPGALYDVEEFFWKAADLQGKETTVTNAQSKVDSDVYDTCFTHPRVIAAVRHVLQEEFLSLGGARKSDGTPPGEPARCLCDPPRTHS